MNIIVCIKQVPGSSEVQIDPVTGVLVRDGSNTKMNPYDLYALEVALRLKEQYGGTVKTISMGPPPALQVLKESLWMGCDDAILISDHKFGGADVVATAYTLSQGIKRFGEYDLIICGKQTTDGDTAQVGPEIAEYLQIPHVAYVEKVLASDEQAITVRAIMDQAIETSKITFPCLLTIEKGFVTPRLPSYRRGRALSDKTIPIITFKDVDDQDENNYGLKGSPTQVERMFAPTKRAEHEMIEGTPSEQANALYELLKVRKLV